MDDTLDNIIDNKVRKSNIVFCGVGKRTKTLEIALVDLLCVTKANLYDISK